MNVGLQVIYQVGKSKLEGYWELERDRKNNINPFPILASREYYRLKFHHYFISNISKKYTYLDIFFSEMFVISRGICTYKIEKGPIKKT